MSFYTYKDLPQVRCHTTAQYRKACAALAHAETVVIDFETTGLDWWEESFRPFYMSATDGETVYGFLDPDKHANYLSLIFNNSKQYHVYWNAKFDLHALSRISFNGEPLRDRGHVEDAMFLARLLDENEPASLEYQSKTYLGEQGAKLSSSVDTWFKENKYPKDMRRYDHLPLDILEPYAMQDVVATWWLYKAKRLQVCKEEGLFGIFDMENHCIQPLVDIETRGYRVNPEHFRALGPRLMESAAEKEHVVKDLLYKECEYEGGEEFNLLSPDCVREIFLDVLGYDPDRFMTLDKKTGLMKISMGATQLEKLDDPIADAILAYREDMKLAGSFGESLLRNCDSEWNLHVNYNQMGPTTGRMSCSDPNIQNIPRVDSSNPDAAKNAIRQGFVARPGKALVYFDYSQIEMRIFAHYCQDQTLLRAIREGLDLHQETAAIIFGKKPEDVTKEERQKAKTINFATIYGAGARGLARQLRVPTPDADMFKRNYMLRFPAIQQFFDDVKDVLRDRGYVKTFFGRRRRLGVEQAHVGPNAIVQGTATGDVHKRGLYLVDQLLKKYGWGHIVNPIHDEIGIEADEKSLDEMIPGVKKIMEQQGEVFDVPLVVDVEVSTTTWGDKHKYEK